MTREEAIKVVKSATVYTPEEMEALETLIPDLRDSEDERIRQWLIQYIKDTHPIANYWNGAPTISDVLSWLEKQKENPKNADSIPSDCASNAKCEKSWHNVQDSLPDNGREVLAKDKLGNLLLARYDGEGWDVSVYDNDDYRCHNGVSRWMDIPLEKQKEQKPNYCHYGGDPSEERCKYCSAACSVRIAEEQKPVETPSPSVIYTEQGEVLAEQKPAEWSEEDEEIFNNIIEKAKGGHWIEVNEITWLINRFKSLRPQWRPSEEQMMALKKAAYNLIGTSTETDVYLVSLYNDLEKLI